MTTLNLQIASSAGDAHAGSIANDSGRSVTSGAHILSSPNGLTSTILSPGSHGSGDEYSAACRFVSVTVPQGATISAATFKMTAQAAYNAGANTISYLVSAEASDNAPALTNSGAGSSLRISGETTLVNRPRTTAVSAAWNQNSVVADTEYSIDVTSVIQELVNRAGWVSGNAILIVVDTNTTCTSGEWQDYYSYDGTAAKSPKLDITYSTGTARDFTGTLAGTSSTPTTTALAVARPLGATLAGTSATPDTATLSVARPLGGTVSGTSSTPDTVTLNTATAWAFGGTLAGTSSTPDTAMLAVARSLGGTIAGTSSTPDTAVVAVARPLGGNLSGTSSTTDTSTLAIARQLTATLAGTSSTPNTVTLNIGTTRENYNVDFGAGYTDVSAKQLVRTSGDRLYAVVMECDAYPYQSGDRLIIKRASSTGVPAGYTEFVQASITDVNTVAVAIDGNDKIHVLMPTRSGGLNYRVWLTSTDAWEATAESVDTGLETNTGQGDQQAAIALDSSGIPHICYIKSDGTRRRLYYRNRSGGSWSAATLVDDQSFGTNERIWTPNIAFDTAGRRVFLWVRGTFNDTADGELFVRTRETNDTWNTTVMISSANALLTGIDQSSSIVITPDNRYHVTWMNGSTTPANKYIRYAYSDDAGATWTRNDPGSGTQATHNPSLGYTTGRLRIYGHGTPDSGNHGENLYYFESTDNGATWSSWTQFVTGTNYDSSVATRWSQYHYSSPTTIDVAYWDDNYPNVLYVGTSLTGAAFTGTLAGASSTPDTVTLTTTSSWAFGGTLAGTSSTPNTATLAVARSLGGTVAGTSSSPDTVTMLLSRALGGTIAGTSTTPDTTTLAVARSLGGTVAGTSSTPDTVTLEVFTGVVFPGTLLGTSTTPDTPALAVARQLAAALAASSSTPDTVVLAVVRPLSLAVLAGTSSTGNIDLRTSLIQGLARPTTITAARPTVSLAARRPRATITGEN